jgi:hypothetical protein
MDRGWHDRDTCCQTQKGSGSTEPLGTGRESGAPRSPAKAAALRPVGFVYFGVMVLTWAGNWPLMKLALGHVPPLVFVLFRLIGSLTLIAPALLVAGQPLLPAR